MYELFYGLCALCAGVLTVGFFTIVVVSTVQESGPIGFLGLALGAGAIAVSLWVADSSRARGPDDLYDHL